MGFNSGFKGLNTLQFLSSNFSYIIFLFLGKEVRTRQGNRQDCYVKSCKKQKEAMNSCAKS